MAPKKSAAKKKVDIEKFQCLWGVLCSMSSLDQEKNNISLFNIIEQFNIPPQFFEEQRKKGVPLAVLADYEIVLSLRRTLDVSFSEEEIVNDLKMRTVDPSGTVIQEVVTQVRFPAKTRRLRYRMACANLTLTTPGGYMHNIEVKDPEKEEFKKILSIPFEVIER